MAVAEERDRAVLIGPKGLDGICGKAGESCGCRVAEVVVPAAGDGGIAGMHAGEKRRAGGVSRPVVPCLQHIGSQVDSGVQQCLLGGGFGIPHQQEMGAAICQPQDDRVVVHRAVVGVLAIRSARRRRV